MLNAIHESNQNINLYNHNRKDSISDNHINNDEQARSDNPALSHDHDPDAALSNDPIAVRLYESKVYGTTYGRGLYRHAFYNGTVDLEPPRVKYLVDLYTVEDWANQARSDEQMLIIRGVGVEPGYLYIRADAPQRSTHQASRYWALECARSPRDDQARLMPTFGNPCEN
jgi:hypothetical protein